VTLAGSRRRVAATFCLCAVAVVLLPRLLPDSAWRETMRDWWPAVYLLLGYWLSGYYFIRPMPGVEQRFLAVDRWLCEPDSSAWVARSLRFVSSCSSWPISAASSSFPAAWRAVVHRHDGVRRPLLDARAHRRIRVVHMLPWIQTRPPRDVSEPRRTIDDRPLAFRAINQAMVSTSIGFNTFPSGHVAGSLAVARGLRKRCRRRRSRCSWGRR
jgi:hypothetical protein